MLLRVETNFESVISTKKLIILWGNLNIGKWGLFNLVSCSLHVHGVLLGFLPQPKDMKWGIGELGSANPNQPMRVWVSLAMLWLLRFCNSSSYVATSWKENKLV